MPDTSSGPIDDASRRRVQEMLVLIVRMSRLFDGPFQRAGLAEVSSNRSVQVLMRLHSAGPVRPRDLQAPTGLTSGGLSKLLDRLVTLGVVERFARGGAGDGRSVLVRLTRSGHAAVRRMTNALVDAHDDCRPLAKELEQLAETTGARPMVLDCEVTDVVELMARAGAVVIVALGRGEGPAAIDATRALTALGYVDLNPQSRPISLVDLLGLSTGGVSKLLDRLEAEGLLERRHGLLESDRRAVVLEVTDAGRARLREQTARVLPYVQEIWAMGHAMAEGISTPV